MAKKSQKKGDQELELDVDVEVDGEEEVSTKESSEEIRKRIAKEIEKDFGKGVMVSGREIVDRPREIISLSPRLDRITGGGVPEGSWVILSGNAKGGKTSLALHFAKKCQSPQYSSRNIYYLNVEGRLKSRDIMGIPGMNPDKITVIESTEDKILSTQDYLSTAEKILYSDKKCVLIIDSVSQLCEEREITGGVGTETRGGGAKIFAQFTRQMGNVVPVKNSIVICILHLGANTSGYGSSVFEKGGNAIQYQADVRLRIEGNPKPWALTEGADPFGQIATWSCKCSALGPPGRKCESYLRYGEGIDETYEIILDAKDVGLISQAGSWFTLDYMQNHMDLLGITEWNKESIKKAGLAAQGANKLQKLLMDKPEWLELLKQEVKKMF